METDLAKALRDFADSVQAKMGAAAKGEPEAQLSAPASSLLETVGGIIHRKVVVKAESALGGRLGIPDFAVLADGTLCGYLELKAPGEGADTSGYRGRNKEQWERFKSQPNIIYTDGNEWCLYQSGEPAEKLLRLTKDIMRYGARGVTEADAEHFHAIVTRFLAWSPIVPRKPREQAALLAPLCRLLREDVADALCDPGSPLVALAGDWRSLLFPEASDERFADAYAQTVTFALLLARSEGADAADLAQAVMGLEAEHTLLSRALQVLTDTRARREIEASLALLQRVINAFPVGTMRPVRDREEAEEDPWLYFYEHFLGVYDAKLRKDSGVYYTPVAVVKCQVALIDELLRDRLHKAGGFSHRDVITLDPAVGTGTYLLGVIDHALEGVASTQGPGAVAGKATTLAGNLHGFELLTGPYAVTELRVTRALKDRGATLPRDGLGILLADALESPFAQPPVLPQFLEPIAEQHRRALDVKDRKSVIVCLGNPPYDRHEAVGDLNSQSRARTGGWVRWGDAGKADGAILSAFIDPVLKAGHGGDLKNLYNLYVYFWRWALWKVFEHTSGKSQDNAGVVSFVSASSYLRGDAFVGMREMLRRLSHEVWVIDLGGEGRGTRRDDNVFNIQTPVAICIALRQGKKDKDAPATVHYTRIHGTREEKYARLASVRSFKDLKWKTCPTDWHAPLRPQKTGSYFKWPRLTDLMPWQQSGQELKRSWPIGPDEDTLRRRWQALLRGWEGIDRAVPFKETRDRKVSAAYPGFRQGEKALRPIAELPVGTPAPPTQRIAFRSLDRQYVMADNRVGDYFRPSLWAAQRSGKQVYLATLTIEPFGRGPALVAAADIPDRHYFNGRGGKDLSPLYRDAAATEPNILPGFLDLWGKKLKRKITPETLAAYVYALLGHSAFVERFWDELEDCQLRVPLTLNGKLFEQAVKLGARLLFLHTYGERFNGRRRHAGPVPSGKARCIETISDKPADYPEKFAYLEQARTLRVGAGALAPVEPAVWDYEVSGLQVVKSWLGYRMKHRKGRKSSPLDDIHPERWTAEFTAELLRLLWILEHTLAMQPELTELLKAVSGGMLLSEADLPPVPEHLRRAPRTSDAAGLFDGEDEGRDQSEA
ncbi:MAG TPA: N-6 DNA methylase [Phycisphaerae bacterium]|nr:N-6 DNA methylase [Phycisphaerae bacterium]HNU44091.1 N-6 DNA methylase [Phycisphaerae bacterium]